MPFKEKPSEPVLNARSFDPLRYFGQAFWIGGFCYLVANFAAVCPKNVLHMPQHGTSPARNDLAN